jgi:hypothetical protein
MMYYTIGHSHGVRFENIEESNVMSEVEEIFMDRVEHAVSIQDKIKYRRMLNNVMQLRNKTEFGVE